MNILFLYWERTKAVATTRDHITAFRKYSRHAIVEMDIYAFKDAKLDLSPFDAIVFHHSTQVRTGLLVSEKIRSKVNSFSGIKALFIQDEMRGMDAACREIEALDISIVFTVVNPEVVHEIYRNLRPGSVRFEHVLTGYVPEELLDFDVPAYEDRPIDVSYRTRALPGWYGDFGQEKSRIADRFLADAPRWNLKCDISCRESDRIYGNDWTHFVANSKAILGTESGASFIDYSGKVGAAVDAFAKEHPEATFEEIRDRFLDGSDGQTVIRVISPRCFEAAALRSLMILYEGPYSGVLEAGRHYVPLARDHANMSEVVAILRDPQRAKAIIDTTYREIACSGKWSYRALVAQFDQVMGEEQVLRKLRPMPPIDDAHRAELEQLNTRLVAQNRRKYELAVALSRLYRSFMELGAKDSQPFLRAVHAKSLKVVQPIRRVLRKLLVW